MLQELEEFDRFCGVHDSVVDTMPKSSTFIIEKFMDTIRSAMKRGETTKFEAALVRRMAKPCATLKAQIGKLMTEFTSLQPDALQMINPGLMAGYKRIMGT